MIPKTIIVRTRSSRKPMTAGLPGGGFRLGSEKSSPSDACLRSPTTREGLFRRAIQRRRESVHRGQMLRTG
jgi:hypothetical protein